MLNLCVLVSSSCLCEVTKMRTARFLGLLLFAALIVAMPSATSAQVAVSITIAPPVLPVYVQPVCPGPGYIWTPGYWAYSEDGYYWVPGTWVEPPEVGFLWTPGYWGWGDGVYLWHAGYWGPHVGFYGGVVYGFGYDGVGFEGGYWRGREFYYNRRVTNVNVTIIHNTYERNVVVRHETRVSYNGGHGGIGARPTHEQERFAHEEHRPATSLQTEHEHGARANPDLRASVNHGRPAVAATPKPGVFKGEGVVPARGGNRTPSPESNKTGGAKPSAAGKPEGRADRPPSSEHKPAPSARPAPNAEHKPAPSNERPNNARPAPSHPSQPAPAARPSGHTESKPAPAPRPSGRTESKPAPQPKSQPQHNEPKQEHPH